MTLALDKTARGSGGNAIMAWKAQSGRGKLLARSWPAFSVFIAAGLAGAEPLPMTLADFHVPGAQVGDITPGTLQPSGNCGACHASFDAANEPMATWKGSLMGVAGRDPLFYAQMATANQDVANVGYLCMRCHVPMAIPSGHALDADGSTLDDNDRDGVSCHLCHTMVDPIYKPGISPPEDEAILAGLADVPAYFGNAMFVFDPSGTRRGPYDDAALAHPTIQSPFHKTGDLCGTCHDVGNVAVSRQFDGSYRYNALDEAAPSSDPLTQFPLERTYTEWKLSAFANGGVDMGGRFGGDGATVINTCQDCHMPQTTAQGCSFGPERSDIARHDFAGASAWVLEIAGIHYAGDPGIDQEALAAGRAKAISMLERALSLELFQVGQSLQVRAINQSGHKIPTGHIEGRRAWVNVQFFDDQNALVGEFGHYDSAEAELDEESTIVYEMRVGLSEYASTVTGLPAGATTHMALADTIVKDTRLPPRGFNNAAYEAAGAPAVGIEFADGQYWHDAYFPIPLSARRAQASVYYQTVTRHYIEALRDGNQTNDWGQILYNLWEQTNRCPPILMATGEISVAPFQAPGQALVIR
jgi:hypothetical protein